MYKANSLRQHLQAAVPDLQRDPDKMVILVKDGRIVSGGEQSLSFEYQATVMVLVLDYAGHADAIMLPILVWLRTHQPEYFDNPALRDKSFRFAAEFNNAKTIDLQIELDLTERVRVSHQDSSETTPPGRYNIEHVGEPNREGTLDPVEHWEIWLKGEKLAEWDYNPLDIDQAPWLQR